MPRTAEAPSRDRVLEFVLTNPGATRADVAGALGLSYHTIEYHLARLADAGRVVEHPFGHGALKHYFPAGSGLARHDRSALVAERRGAPARVLRRLREDPGAPVAAHARALGVSASTVAWHAQQLALAGLLPTDAR